MDHEPDRTRGRRQVAPRAGGSRAGEPGRRGRADIIAAPATPPGRGAIGVVRISGSALEAFAEQLLGSRPPPRQALLRDFLDQDGSAIDRGIALYFPAPNSFTGEDVIELQGHGGPVPMDRLLERACGLGARLARPGEFTERAFLNGKIDLVEAEAVADLIDSASRRAARSAMRSLTGEFSRRLLDIDGQVMALRVTLEAAIDFPEEEDVDLLDAERADARLTAVECAVSELLAEARVGQVLRDGVDVVLLGAPNVGKSSLLNRLLSENRAIVTDIPGTTRDLLLADIEIDGVPIRLTDTAGVRAGGDEVEAIGVERALASARRADLVLLIADDADASGELTPTALAGLAGAVIEVRNKVDLSGRAASEPGDESRPLRVSARTGAGIDALRAAIVGASGAAPGQGAHLARARHLGELNGAVRHLALARQRLAEGYGDLAAEELRAVHRRLGEIVGAATTEDLLGEIFSSFCIGK